ncbi:MAG TPA: hypothetical protein PLP14_05700, partial [Chitinophagaceae bacterium]|nr:hypothetical protein [Chitinophagaceae bacterium]
MNKQLLLVAYLVVCSLRTFAQDESDAIRMGNQDGFGTARGMALGMAAGSMGADFSGVSVNPAGLGLYRNSEFVFTPTIQTRSSEGDYLGSNRSAMSLKFNFSNLGLIVTQNLKERKQKSYGWRYFNYALGMNRLQSFRNKTVYSGVNRKNSLTDAFADEFNQMGGLNSNSIAQVSYASFAAYQTWLLDLGQGPDSNLVVSYVPVGDGIEQTKTVIEKGGISEYVVAAGGNYKDRLYLGLTLGIPVLRYNRNTQFNEEDISGNNDNDFRYMHFTESLKTEGTGVNLKLGMIYKFHPLFRAGISIQTPTHYELNDLSEISMETHTDSLLIRMDPQNSPVSSYQQDSALVFNYSFNSPYKATGSFCFLFNQYGLITMDLDFINYRSMRYGYTLDYETEENKINEVLKST